MKGRTPPGADGEGAVTRTVAIDVTDARCRYRAELEAALACAGGKTRKRTFPRMVQEVPEHRGGELVDPDETVLVWSDLHLGHANIIEYQDWPFLDVADQDAELWKAWERIDPGAVLVVVGDVAMSEAVCKALTFLPRSSRKSTCIPAPLSVRPRALPLRSLIVVIERNRERERLNKVSTAMRNDSALPPATVAVGSRIRGRRRLQRGAEQPRSQREPGSNARGEPGASARDEPRKHTEERTCES